MRVFLFTAACIFFCYCRTAGKSENKEKAETATILQTEFKEEKAPADNSDGPLKTDSLVFLSKVNKVLKRAGKEQFSTQYAILADLGLNSGSNRIFLVRLTDKKILETGLVTHGSSTTYLPIGQRVYSNIEGSLCSSLGIYKIGASYTGQYGLAYKLFGLDTDNSNAYTRAIVLHSHNCVPDQSTNEPICQSWGCPTVSPAFLKTLAVYINQSDLPILLYLFDSVKEQTDNKTD